MIEQGDGGRTGRAGAMIVTVTEDSRYESYVWICFGLVSLKGKREGKGGSDDRIRM